MHCRMNETDKLLQRINAYCERKKISPAAFGRKAFNDSSFVSDLKVGRSPTARTIQRAKDFLRGI